MSKHYTTLKGKPTIERTSPPDVRFLLNAQKTLTIGVTIDPTTDETARIDMTRDAITVSANGEAITLAISNQLRQAMIDILKGDE